MYNLKELQDKELEILLSIDRVCKQLNIEYILMYGTLLGAVRHKGFIPWDDDIDIAMTRENYDKFVSEAANYLPEHLQIQHYSHEKECPNIYVKVRDKNTTFLHKEHIDLDIVQGIFVDIFPIERLHKHKYLNKLEFVRKKIFNLINQSYDLAYVKSIKRKTSIVIGYFIHYVIVKGLLRNVKRCDFIRAEDQRRLRKHLKGGEHTMITIDKNIVVDYSLFEDIIPYSFEGHDLPGPKDYDTLLAAQYGQYMQIPPKEQQVTHKPLLVDTKRGYHELRENKD